MNHSQPRLQPLPRRVRPFLGETLRSYLDRLAEANGLNVDDLHQLLGASRRHRTFIPIEGLTAATGVPERHLFYGLPELRYNSPMKTSALSGRFVDTTLACRRCTATKAIPATTQVTVWAREDRPICLRHRLWLGYRNCRPEDQVNLTTQPETIRAQVRHRRLTRRFGFSAVQEAVTTAYSIAIHEDSKEVFHEFDANRKFECRMRRFFDEAQADRLPRTYFDAAHYPDIIALAALLLSPHWRSVMLGSPLREKLEFFRELHRFGLIRGGAPRAIGTVASWLDRLAPVGRPPIPRWVLLQLQFWPPGRADPLDYYEHGFFEEPIPLEWHEMVQQTLGDL
ncbi:TniQ family protein [Glycomyces salinus]|uniref:TniQ family protein n=1 Tax=Glycomyces salinus TaxID=980294 RepID=UPI0018EBDC51|nr:TniQ family protein [Glycomyces salinus]